MLDTACAVNAASGCATRTELGEGPIAHAALLQRHDDIALSGTVEQVSSCSAFALLVATDSTSGGRPEGMRLAAAVTPRAKPVNAGERTTMTRLSWYRLGSLHHCTQSSSTQSI